MHCLSVEEGVHAELVVQAVHLEMEVSVCGHSESIAGAGLTIGGAQDWTVPLRGLASGDFGLGLARARVVAAAVATASEGERSSVRAERTRIQVNKRLTVLPSRAKLCTGVLGGGGGVRGTVPS
jgi:hypothetical protein